MHHWGHVKKARTVVIPGLQVFIECQYVFVYSMCISVHIYCFGFSVCVSIHAWSQKACALYWLSQNSSGPGVIVCLCVTDTSRNRAKTGLAAPAVSQPNLLLSVWLACMAILSASAYRVCACTRVGWCVKGALLVDTRGCLSTPTY